MTHEELIKVLRSKNCCGDVCHCDEAADCIEQLVKERDDAEQREITKIEVNHRRVVGFLNRAKVAEAKLAKAVDILKCITFTADSNDHDGWYDALNDARYLVAELEKTE
jgi:hypothetical protein